MLLTFEERLSDSPFIERVWRSRSASAGSFISIASTHCEMVVTRCKGEVFLTLRGPEKRATVAQCPSDGEWIGVRAETSYGPDGIGTTIGTLFDETGAVAAIQQSVLVRPMPTK